jgi:flagellin
MALSINHNLMALTAYNNLNRTYTSLASSINSLSSGLRINNASDDAAGLAVRELMRSDIAILNQGIRNANDAISLLQTMDGAASVIDEKLIRMKELAEQASTGTYSTVQRQIMDSEFQEMANEIERIANATDFNGVKMLNTQGVTSGVYGIAEDNQLLAAGDAFISAFTEYASGDTLTLNWTDADGTAGSSSMTVTDSTTITAAMTFMDDAIDPTTSVNVAWGNDGLTVTDMAGGDTQFNIQFSGGGSYAFTEDTLGTDGQT